MRTNAPQVTETEAEEPDFKPLTAEEAAQWRRRNPPLSVWRVVAGQALVGAVVAMLAWLFTSKSSVAWSAGYGALAVVLPAALFARGLARQKASANAGAALVGFFVWEFAKLVLTAAMLALAPRVVKDVSWLALLVGMVVVMKTYWVALLVRPGGRKQN
ncbi:MAG: ATP synthase subunit I [Acidovorax sp.]